MTHCLLCPPVTTSRKRSMQAGTTISKSQPTYPLLPFVIVINRLSLPLATSTYGDLTPSTNAIGGDFPLVSTRQTKGTAARRPHAPPAPRSPSRCAAALAGCSDCRHGGSFISIIRFGHGALQMQMSEGASGQDDHGMEIHASYCSPIGSALGTVNKTQ